MRLKTKFLLLCVFTIFFIFPERGISRWRIESMLERISEKKAKVIWRFEGLKDLFFMFWWRCTYLSAWVTLELETRVNLKEKKNIKNLFLLSLTEDVWDKRSVCFLVIMHGGVFSLYGGKKNGNVDASLRRIIIMSKLSKAHITPWFDLIWFDSGVWR